MKLFKKSLIVLGTLVTIIMLFAIFAVNTAAIPAEYENIDDLVYYFSDFYPSIDEETLSEYYSGCEIVYEHQWLDENTFGNYLGYFYNLGQDCVLILDIKTFRPDTDDLLYLLRQTKEQTNCTIIFISTYDIPSCLEFVDEYCYIPPAIAFDRLKTFAGDFVNDIYYKYMDIEYHSIIVDGRFMDFTYMYNSEIDITDIDFEDWDPEDIDAVIEASVFMKHMLQRLAYWLQYNIVDSANDSDTIPDYHTFLAHMQNNYYINIFAHIGECYYLDLATLTVIEASEVDDISSEGYEMYYLYAVGFWYLDQDFYDFLYEEQDYFEGIYVMTLDPLVEGDDGLPVITDHDICSSNLEEAFVCEYLFGEYY